MNNFKNKNGVKDYENIYRKKDNILYLSFDVVCFRSMDFKGLKRLLRELNFKYLIINDKTDLLIAENNLKEIEKCEVLHNFINKYKNL